MIAALENPCAVRNPDRPGRRSAGAFPCRGGSRGFEIRMTARPAPEPGRSASNGLPRRAERCAPCHPRGALRTPAADFGDGRSGRRARARAGRAFTRVPGRRSSRARIGSHDETRLAPPGHGRSVGFTIPPARSSKPGCSRGSPDQRAREAALWDPGARLAGRNLALRSFRV